MGVGGHKWVTYNWGELVSGGLISGGRGRISGKIDFPYTNV